MISVLTLVKDREGHLRNLVAGLRRSAVPPSELVIVDMGDTPLTQPECDFPVSVVRLEAKGLPLAKARNLAAAQACSDQLLFLDVDCIPVDRLVGAMSTGLLQHDALICAEILYLGANDVVGERWTQNALIEVGLPHPARPFPSKGVRREANPGLFWTVAFGVARTTFEKIGGFDEAFTGYGGEDTDFSFKAREKGFELLFLGGHGALHQHHAVVHPPLQHFGDIIRNAGIFYRKWGFWPMEGWLSAFQRLGLIIWTETSLRIIQQPTAQQLSRARCNEHVRF